ncbi:MAG: galactose ABC transporter substrate-binding protein [Tissierellia bacterium]|nr:galactose ABC transporter substrate-binding protein [Tissierellia bacterium]
MKNKKMLALLLALVMMGTMMVACGKKEEAPAEPTGEATTETPEATEPAEGGGTIGALYYNYSDTYISTVRSNFDEYAKEAGFELNVQDGQNNQGTQNDQIDNVISKGVDALLVNIVDTGAAVNVIDKAKAADLPLIFFNREPEDISVYGTYDKSRFVGTRKEEAGIIQGEMVVEAWADGAADRNGNGKLDYVLFHGGLDNAEAIARSEYAVKTIVDAGIEINKIGEQIANWDAEQAKLAMDAIVAKNLEDIDFVLANNDSMAMGAVNALKAVGYNTGDPDKYIPVYGVDATEEAKEAISKGEMAGTVKQDAEAMAKAMLTLAQNAIEGKEFIEGTDYEYDESGVAVRIPYQPYTGE